MGSMQVVATLPESLLLTIFPLIPLSCCLLRLPPSCHRPALLSHHRSIDQDRRLQLAAVSLLAMRSAVAAIATCTTLVSVSLAGQSPHTALSEFSAMLRALRALTALDLRDTGLSHTPTASTLAAALPSLKHLASLDLSDNLATVDTVSALAPGLRRCSALLKLRMLRAFSPYEPDSDAAACLAPPLQSLTNLTSLSLGGIGCMHQPEDRAAFAPALVSLLEDGVMYLPALQKLELRFYEVDLLLGHVRVFIKALECIQNLECLRLDVPLLGNPPLNFVGSPLDMFEPPTDKAMVHTLHATFCQTLVLGKQLTALDLDLCSLRFPVRPVLFIHRAIAQLPQLRQLRLHFSVADCWRLTPIDNIGALADVITKLSHVTLLHVRVATRHPLATGLPNMASLRRLLTAATDHMPQLQELHVPMAVCSRDSTGLVDSLTGISQLERLTLDMYLGLRYSTEDTPADAHDADFLESYFPLFPYARMIDANFEDDYWLEPLGAGATALTQLHALHLYAVNPVHGLGGLMRHIGSMRALKDLQMVGSVCMPIDSDWRDFCSGVDGLTGLTSLRTFTGPATPRPSHPMAQYFPELLQYLPQSLLKLRIPAVAAADTYAYIEGLSRLRLRTLLVDRGTGATRDMGPLRAVVAELCHLRALTVMCGGDDVEQVEEIAEQVPTCHCEPYQEVMDVDEA